MNQEQLNSRIDGLREKAVSTIDELLTQARESEGHIATPPQALAASRNRLSDSRYKVLVVGEAKRGKSTFINALFGRHLLPTDVDIATSQVFLVSDAEQEAYRVRLEDDSCIEIQAEDLNKYGSQVLADAGETPRLDQIIRWIEVNVPARFLPEGVSILDTPGLGSLHADHDRITQRFIPQADAVIYTLDSLQPLGKFDLDALARILKTTSHVLFIQTMIDKRRRAEWQGIQQRNEQLLRQHFSERLADTRVWPISSTNLMQAAESGDKDFELVSRYPELAAALRSFLFRSTGWNRSAAAVSIAGSYYDTVHRTLAGQVATTRLTPDELAALKADLAERKRVFEEEWGEKGDKFVQYTKDVEEVVKLATQRFKEMLQSNGSIQSSMLERIDAAGNTQAAIEIGQSMGNDIATAIAQTWQDVTGKAQQQIRELLEPFLVTADKLETPLQALVLENIDVSRRRNFMDRIKSGVIEDKFVGGYAKWLLLYIYPPLGVAAFVVSIWSFFRGMSQVAKQQKEVAQNDLRRHLGKLMGQALNHFYGVDKKLRKAPADEYFSAMREKAIALVQTTRDERVKDLGAQIAHLDKQETVRAQANAWRTLKEPLGELEDELGNLDLALRPSA